jgi:hypothetical protein
MRRCYRLLLIGLILGGSLLSQQPGAGIVEPALRQFMPPSSRAPNDPPTKSAYLSPLVKSSTSNET